MWRFRLLLCIAVLLVIIAPGGAAASQTQGGAAPRTVWIIGDSLARGLYATGEAQMYRNLLFDEVQARYPGQVRLLFWQEMCSLARLEDRWDRIEDVPPPDILFLELGLNDVVQTSGCEHVPDDAWQALLGAVLDRFQALSPNAQIVVGTIPWSGWPEGHEMRLRARAYNHWIFKQAEARGLVVADLWAATLDRQDGLSSQEEPNPFPPAYRGDGFHPNDLGHRRLAQTFWTAYLLRHEQSGLVYLPFQAHRLGR